jgi:hypothetical protein
MWCIQDVSRVYPGCIQLVFVVYTGIKIHPRGRNKIALPTAASREKRKGYAGGWIQIGYMVDTLWIQT